MISYAGGVDFCRIDGKLNSDKYKENILENFIKTNENLTEGDAIF